MNQRLRNELALISTLGAIVLFTQRKDRVGLGLIGTAAVLKFLPLGKRFSFRGRHAVITGGSRGLGLAMAQLLVKEGAKVTLLARDEDELVEAERQLKNLCPGALVEGVICDVTKPDQLSATLKEANQRLGSIEVLINNAGAVAAGPFTTMESEDFRAQIDLHLNAVVESTRQILPYFRAQGGGRILNICSIGGKIAIPHMSTYSASKFALSGFSKCMAAELAAEGIYVTTVYPGLMRTGSPIQGVFKGNHEREFAWFATSNLTPGVSMSASRAARQALEACRNGDNEAVLSLPAKFGGFAESNFPEITALVLRTVARWLPAGDSRQRRTGAESQGWLNRQFWSAPLRQLEKNAAAKFNQTAKSDADFNLGV